VTPREWRHLWSVVGVVAFCVLFTGFMVFLAVRDTRAEDRCEAMGGQTWDSGKHCVLGDPRVVSTR
jgi:hypothetical protein